MGSLQILENKGGARRSWSAALARYGRRMQNSLSDVKLWGKITGKQNHGKNVSSCAETGKLLTLPPGVIPKKPAQVCGPQLIGKSAFFIHGIQETQSYNHRHHQVLRDPRNPDDGFRNGFTPLILSHPCLFRDFFSSLPFFLPSFLPSAFFFSIFNKDWAKGGKGQGLVGVQR